MTVSCIWERLKDEHEVDVFQTVKQLRFHRPELVVNLVCVSHLIISSPIIRIFYYYQSLSLPSPLFPPSTIPSSFPLSRTPFPCLPYLPISFLAAPTLKCNKGSVGPLKLPQQVCTESLAAGLVLAYFQLKRCLLMIGIKYLMITKIAMT